MAKVAVKESSISGLGVFSSGSTSKGAIEEYKEKVQELLEKEKV